MRKPRIPGYHDIGPEFHFDMERWQGGEPVAAGLVLGPLEPNVYGVRRPGWCLYPSEMPEQSRQAWTGGTIRALRSPVTAGTWRPEELKAAEIPEWQALLDGGSLTVARTPSWLPCGTWGFIAAAIRAGVPGRAGLGGGVVLDRVAL